VPITDDYGQSFSGLDYGDEPDLKVLSENLLSMTGQTVMRFASASARNATLSAPVAGMVAWLKADELLTVFDGGTWVVVGAGTQSWTTVPLVSGFTHNGNSNGNFQYRTVNLFGEQTLMFRGAVAVTYSGSAGATIPNLGVLNSAALPVAARPSSLRTIVVPCSDVSSVRITLKLDVQPDGFLKIYGTGSGSDGTSAPPWIGFNGCFVSL
jgi:hypothetical protein